MKRVNTLRHGSMSQQGIAVILGGARCSEAPAGRLRCSLAAQPAGIRSSTDKQERPHVRGPEARAVPLAVERFTCLRLCGCLKDAIDIYDHIRFEGDERGKSSVLFAIWYLIDVASGIKLQNMNLNLDGYGFSRRRSISFPTFS
jgi:hypothetical protein